MNLCLLWRVFILMLLAFFSDAACRDSNSWESKSLAKFFKTVDPGNWLNIDVRVVPDCCTISWAGVACDIVSPNITEIRLDNMKLNGTIDAVSVCSVSSLRVLSLANSLIHGVIPNAISNCHELTYLNLSSTMLTGGLPTSIGQLKKLSLIDISNTNITGPIPEFEQIVQVYLPNSTKLIISSSKDGVPMPSSNYEYDAGSAVKRKMRIPFSDFLPLLLVLALFLLFIHAVNKKVGKLSYEKEKEKEITESIKEVTEEKLPICTEEGTEKKGEQINLVFFCEKCKRFCTDDLLKSAADLQGQNFYSTLYKVKLADSTIFAVKRLRNLQISGDEFRRKFTWIGSLKHPNILPLVAVNSSENENLLIYAFQRRGSLSSLLSSYAKRKREFPWRERLTIMSGIARGLNYIAQESNEEHSAHGNLKPSNIILSDNEEPLISEFGVWGLLDPKRTFLYSSNGYRAPEKRLTKEADIFSFGIILLELLTGKIVERGTLNLPKWVKSMVREEWTGEVFDKEVGKAGKQWAFPLLNIALKCVSDLPENRPRISEVLEKIELVFNSQENHSFSSTSSMESSQHDDLIHSVIAETGETPGNY